jgi:DNA-binding CsgD family transcriptional regulator
MIGSAYKNKSWDIPKEMYRFFNTKRIDETLGLFNRACDGSFYIADYYHEKMLVGDSSHSTFSGYSRTFVEKEGFEFYRRILSPSELEWFQKVHKEASKILYSYPESQRINLEFSYDLLATTINGKEMILHYKLVPFQFDKNGNMWLGLIFCTQLFSRPIGPKASIDNFETGDKYEFVNGEFVLSKIKALTNDEISILKWIATGIPCKNMCDLLNISERSLRRREQSAFAKLGADTPASAVYKATSLGII